MQSPSPEHEWLLERSEGVCVMIGHCLTDQHGASLTSPPVSQTCLWSGAEQAQWEVPPQSCSSEEHRRKLSMALIRPNPSVYVCAPWILASCKAGTLTQPDSRNATRREVAAQRHMWFIQPLQHWQQAHEVFVQAYFENSSQSSLCQLQKCPVVTFSFCLAWPLLFCYCLAEVQKDTDKCKGFHLAEGNHYENYSYSNIPYPLRFGGEVCAQGPMSESQLCPCPEMVGLLSKTERVCFVPTQSFSWFTTFVRFSFFSLKLLVSLLGADA